MLKINNKIKNIYKKYLISKLYSQLYNLFIIKLINRLLRHGNKERSLKLLYKLKYLIKKRTKKEPLFILLFSMLKGLFQFYFIKKRLGSVIKDLPMPLLKDRQVRYFVKALYRFSIASYSRVISLVNLANLLIRTFRRKSILIQFNNKN